MGMQTNLAAPTALAGRGGGSARGRRGSTDVEELMVDERILTQLYQGHTFGELALVERVRRALDRGGAGRLASR